MTNNMLLFDTAPEEPEKSKKKPKRSKEWVAPQEEPVFAPEITGVNYEILGQVRDLHECADTRCSSKCFDIIDDHNGEWKIECVVCGTGQRVPAVEGILKQKERFTMRDGIFSGLSLDEIARQENGMKYITWAASSHKRAEVREACKAWLDSLVGQQ